MVWKGRLLRNIFVSPVLSWLRRCRKKVQKLWNYPESISSPGTAAHPLQVDFATEPEPPKIATSEVKRQNSTTEVPVLVPRTIQDIDATSGVPIHHRSIPIDAPTEVILLGRLADLNYLIRAEEGRAVSEDLQHLIFRVSGEIETWVNGGGTMEFEAQLTLSNVMNDRPAKDGIYSQFVCKDGEKCLLAGYLSVLQSATTNDALPDERRILLNRIHESRVFVTEPENATTDKAHQDELNVLHISCDSNIALHSIEMGIQALNQGLPLDLSHHGVGWLTHSALELGSETANASLTKKVAFTPLNNPDRPLLLSALANSHLCRFERFGEVKDIELAIERQREAVASTPSDSAGRPGLLNDLGKSYLRHFERFGEMKDLHLAIERQLEAIASTPVDSADRPGLLNNLGTSYQRRFQRIGEVKDIDLAIERQLEAVASSPLDSADRPALLNNLGNSYQCRFERFGEVKDIDSAIEQQLEAVTSSPLDSADRPGRLNNLGISYQCRFQQFGEVKDIDLAIKQQLDAVNSSPVDSADRPQLLSNLGNSYQYRFQWFGEAKDIESAIERLFEAVASSPPDSAGRTAFLNNLGNSYLRRFQRFREVKDLDSAIERQLDAVASSPLDSSDRPRLLNNLGRSYLHRFQQFGEVKDIDSAIERLLEAIASSPLDSADRPVNLHSLAEAYLRRFACFEELTDLQEAICNFRLAALSEHGLPSSRIMGSLAWARLAQLSDLESASEAFDQAIHLLPQVAWIGLSAVAQLNMLDSDMVQTLGSDAAACMIALAVQADSHDKQRHLSRAIELLDQGRSILWSQTSNLERDLEDLREVDSQLAFEFELVGKALRQGCFRNSNDTLSETDAQHYRRSAKKWEGLVSRIRSLPGFGHFLLPPPIHTLRTAVVDGPVVIINSSEFRCDAVIIPPQLEADLVLVPLPDVTAEKLNTLSNQQEIFASRKSRIGIPLDDGGEPLMTLENVLNETWLLVGEPILKQLKDLGLLGSGASATCRVWWCLTGSLSFLPIHASFPPNKSGIGMMDTVVSSYTPTLSALLRAQQRKEIPTFRMLAVGQSSASGLMSLPGVTQEIAYISRKLGADVQTLEECNATVDEVTTSLPTCSWVHFACHGVQDPHKPMDSGLMLSDGHRLTLSRLAQSSLASAEFAFLSCCQSAKGSKQFPNEAIHLAAGLQFIRFRGVIGTLWSVGDTDALSIAMEVYDELFKDGTAQVSPSGAAVALHQAVCHLRDRVPLARWVPFVHFGL